MKKLILLIPLTAILFGCQTTATSQRFTTAQENALTCQEHVLAYKAKLASSPKVMFTTYMETFDVR